ncbi:hypothetical protein KFE25_010470 [Diacronema lutheri]|uniref:Uncharacterized protein n=1 Tax=Diacronema lutheri TaxID=2081491 RepID=A0A8J5X7T3_DIALT|nr:hypothetical protein KFE25_010470 [Diacronema lutheri]
MIRRRAAVSSELSDSELHAELRKAVDAISDPELRRELQEDTWQGLRERYPVSSDFLEAMREIEEEKRLRQRNVSLITAVGLVVSVAIALVRGGDLSALTLPTGAGILDLGGFASRS